MAECKHDIEVSSCHFCTPRVRDAERRLENHGRWGPVFAAAYDGECSACPAEITAGDMIRADGEGGWLCAECSAEAITYIPRPPTREDLENW